MHVVLHSCCLNRQTSKSLFTDRGKRHRTSLCARHLAFVPHRYCFDVCSELAIPMSYQKKLEVDSTQAERRASLFYLTLGETFLIFVISQDFHFVGVFVIVSSSLSFLVENEIFLFEMARFSSSLERNRSI